jgi:hypothetical protein
MIFIEKYQRPKGDTLTDVIRYVIVKLIPAYIVYWAMEEVHGNSTVRRQRSDQPTLISLGVRHGRPLPNME